MVNKHGSSVSLDTVLSLHACMHVLGSLISCHCGCWRSTSRGKRLDVLFLRCFFSSSSPPEDLLVSLHYSVLSLLLKGSSFVVRRTEAKGLRLN